jgi:hypothetical protein
MIAADYNEQLAVTLPEESQLSDILNSYQRWQEATKKLFHLGALKSGVTLETLQTFLAECDAMPIELESESKQIRSIVSEASEWIQSFSGVLQALRIPITSISIAPSPPPPPAAAATTTEGGDVALEANENETNEKTTKTETEEETEIGYSELKILIDAAHNVTIHFPELMYKPAPSFLFLPLCSFSPHDSCDAALLVRDGLMSKSGSILWMQSVQNDTGRSHVTPLLQTFLRSKPPISRSSFRQLKSYMWPSLMNSRDSKRYLNSYSPLSFLP